MKLLILIFLLLLSSLYADSDELKNIEPLLDNNLYFKAVTAARELYQKDKQTSTFIFLKEHKLS